MGSLMHKRCLKRILEETNVRERGATDPAHSKPAKRCRGPATQQFSSIACACDTDTHTVKANKPHVSFSLSPKVVLIDGLGSDIIKRQRCEIWYTREDYRVFWRDRIDSVRLWQMVYGGEHGENDDSDLEMLLDEQFTVRGLESYTTDQSNAKTQDPKKNNYVQTVLREQQQNSVVEPNVIRRLAGKMTQASLERAQKIAMEDAREAQRDALGCASPEGRSLSIGPTQQQCDSPPISPASVVEFDMARTSKNAELRKRVLAHMDKSSGSHHPHFQPRRCSMQMHGRKGPRMAPQGRISQERHPMQQPIGHRRPSLPPVNLYPYQQQQAATPMMPTHENHAAGQYQQQQHYYEQQPYGPRGLRRDSMGMCYGAGAAEPMLRHRFEAPDAAAYENHQHQYMGANQQHRMVRDEANFAPGLTFSPRHKSNQPVRRQSLQGPYGNNSYPHYETYVGEYSGMRRDSLGGQYSARGY